MRKWRSVVDYYLLFLLMAATIWASADTHNTDIIKNIYKKWQSRQLTDMS